MALRSIVFYFSFWTSGLCIYVCFLFCFVLGDFRVIRGTGLSLLSLSFKNWFTVLISVSSLLWTCLTTCWRTVVYCVLIFCFVHNNRTKKIFVLYNYIHADYIWSSVSHLCISWLLWCCLGESSIIFKQVHLCCHLPVSRCVGSSWRRCHYWSASEVQNYLKPLFVFSSTVS